MKKLETATNCAVLVVALLMSVVMVKQFLLPHNDRQSVAISDTSEQLNEPLKGKVLALSGVRRNSSGTLRLSPNPHIQMDSLRLPNLTNLKTVAMEMVSSTLRMRYTPNYGCG